MLWDSLSTLPVSAYIPLILVFAATVAILGTFSGVGGGVLHIPVMVWVLTEIDLKEIKFISTILVFASALINTAIAMYKKEINYWIMIVAVVVATPTIFLGNYINNLINSGITEIIIVILLSYVTIQLIINQYVFKKRSVEQNMQRRWYHIYLQKNGKLVNGFFLCLVVVIAGMVTSLTGMGGGVILMPFLILVIKLNIKDSAPISHSIILITSFLTIIIESAMGNENYFKDSHAMINVTTPMICGAVAGTVAAAFLKRFIKKEVVILWILIVLIWASIAKMIYDLSINGIN
jgi:uncharacterized membrane protein YfcA